MIIGNPYVFSIIIDIADEWNVDKSFNNGLLFICINGTLIPNKILNATLNVEILPLIKKLENPIKNIDIFSMEKKDAFVCIYRQTFPEGYDEGNDSYNITPLVFLDNNYFVFMVSDGKQVRILAAGLQYIIEESIHNLEEIEVVDAYVSKEELEKIIKKLKIFEKKGRED